MRRRLLPVVIALVASILFATPAFAWSNGPNWGNGFGTHDWILYEAGRLAGSPTWLKMSTALSRTDNPDMNFHDFWYHCYDRWGTHYGNSPKKVVEYFNKAVSAYKSKSYKTASIDVAYMSHYYADTLDPLHTDSTTAEKKMHSRWEEAVDSRLTYKGEHRSWIHYDGYQTVSSVSAKTISGARYAHQFYTSLVKNYNASRYNSAVSSITRKCLNKAVNGLADLIRQIAKGNKLN